MSSITVRQAEADDLARLGLETEGKFWGRVGIRRGVIVAAALLFWENDGDPAMVNYSAASSNVRPRWLAREARRLLADAPQEVRDVIAICDHRIPRSREILVWLGFQETGREFGGYAEWIYHRA